jgi:protein-tyrosine kinase
MSLVELALKKMQEAARGGSPARDLRDARQREPVIGEVHERTGPRSAEGGPRFNTDKIVKVDPRALCAAGLFAPEHQQRELTDQYRQVKRPLIAGAIGRGSPRLERGQAIMMARAMERDASVLLVDADVPKPHISRTFGVEKEVGLLDVLRDEKLDVESAILPTDRPGLSLLPAGQRSDTATELLASNRMRETIERLTSADSNRIVLIDSPPLLLTSESRALASWVGQIVLVVRAEITPQQAVLDAIAHLGEGKSVSLVLNQCLTTTPAYYYGYAPEQTDR